MPRLTRKPCFLMTSALIACLFLLSACSRPDMPSLSGEGFKIRSGNWQLVNYWASWCTPCRDEIPELNRFSERHGIKIYGVNYDNLEGDELEMAIEDMGIQFDSLLSDPAKLLGQTRPRILPVTFVINPNGEVVKVLTGPQTEQDLIAATQ
ncbi:TlpA family protein disulfide reductase [Spongiibacter sp. KMU-158]|uniref:TlpA family protein disulfide reductase n=1 Tax=Spongiibacter pelagi TaxID=2760804 RepID=A0A927C392_9GAMM|nr:TlpA disulfide reductase family protein [Spongiibacter pelagi]MBD2858670.1 TlpA family protein disulfide reductase [Spongiibacter pelagi]